MQNGKYDYVGSTSKSYFNLNYVLFRNSEQYNICIIWIILIMGNNIPSIMHPLVGSFVSFKLIIYDYVKMKLIERNVLFYFYSY